MTLFRTTHSAILLIIVVTFLVGGCSWGGSKKKSRGSLSDAAAEAEKKPKDQDVVQREKTKTKDDPAGPRDEDEFEEHDHGGGSVAVGAGGGSETRQQYAPEDDTRMGWHLGFEFGGGSLIRRLHTRLARKMGGYDLGLALFDPRQSGAFKKPSLRGERAYVRER